MPKPTLLLVFQDCYDCGAHKAWHDGVREAAAKNKVLICYVPHTLSEAKELILEAHKQGVEVPFLTDGKRYSRTLEDLVKTTAKMSEKHSSKEVKHGDNPETAG